VIEGDAGATVFDWPSGVDLDQLSTLAENPKEGNKTQFRDIPPQVLSELREIAPSEACVFVISNNILTGSQNKYFAVHNELVRSIGGLEPKVLPMFIFQGV